MMKDEAFSCMAGQNTATQLSPRKHFKTDSGNSVKFKQIFGGVLVLYISFVPARGNVGMPVTVFSSFRDESWGVQRNDDHLSGIIHQKVRWIFRELWADDDDDCGENNSLLGAGASVSWNKPENIAKLSIINGVFHCKGFQFVPLLLLLYFRSQACFMF